MLQTLDHQQILTQVIVHYFFRNKLQFQRSQTHRKVNNMHTIRFNNPYASGATERKSNGKWGELRTRQIAPYSISDDNAVELIILDFSVYPPGMFQLSAYK